MPYAAPKPCTYPGCSVLVEGGSRCSKHKYNKQGGSNAPDIKRLYNSARWKRARLAFLASHPFCRYCLRHGRNTFAEVVDHIKPHKGNVTLFYDQNNWQALCKPCHDKKTYQDDGALGNVSHETKGGGRV